MYNSGKAEPELWAVTDGNGMVLWSRGGSSSKSKLMVYNSEQSAKAALRNNWTKQVHNESEVEIRKIYSCQP